ncbi:MAG: magnesium transporter [Pseudomonadota bacterium]
MDAGASERDNGGDGHREVAVYAPRDDDGSLSTAYVQRIDQALSEGDVASTLLETRSLHESDLADLLEALSQTRRLQLVRAMGDDFSFAALTELDDDDRKTILDQFTSDEVAEAVKDLDNDDAVYILEDLDEPEQQEILAKLPFADRAALSKALDYPDESAGRRMQSDFIAVPPYWNVGQTIDYMRESDDLPNDFYEIFVIDPTYRLVGSVALDKILRTKRPVSIRDIMIEDRKVIDANVDQEEAARIFERYDLVSAAVVDDSQRLVGVLTIDDIVDVIHEEAEEDILRLAGVGDESLSTKVWSAVKSRFTWLSINLVTAVIASLVIGLFDATIEQMVALAVLMPIVASMGGNAGTQTMTVAVRALAVQDMDNFNSRRIILREMAIGLVNGVVFAVMVGIVAIIWFRNVELGAVIAVAMVANMFAAGLAGILIPIGLSKLKIDPAIASSTFVTTVTDVVGFFVFLWLAGWWFGLM